MRIWGGKVGAGRGVRVVRVQGRGGTAAANDSLRRITADFLQEFRLAGHEILVESRRGATFSHEMGPPNFDGNSRLSEISSANPKIATPAQK